MQVAACEKTARRPGMGTLFLGPALLAAALVVVVPVNAGAQPDLRSRQVGDLLAGDPAHSLRSRAVFYKIARSSPREFSIVARALEFHESGVPPAEVLRRVDEMRGARAQLSALESPTSTFASELAIGAIGATAGWFVGGPMGAMTGGSLGAMGGAGLAVGLDVGVRSMRNRQALERSRRPWWEVRSDPGYQAVSRALEDETFREIWNGGFSDQLGARWDEPANQLVEDSGLGLQIDETLGAGTTRDLLEAVRTSKRAESAENVSAAEERTRLSQRLERRVIAKLEENRKATAETLTELRVGQELLGASLAEMRNNQEAIREWVVDFEDRERKQELDRLGKRRDRARERINEANTRAVVGSVVNVISLVDGEVGPRLGALATAAFQFSDEVDALKQAIEIGANVNLASLAFSGNLLTIGTNLFSALAGIPSTEQQILNEIRELRREMAEGFNRVHEHLEGVRTEMHGRFDLLDGAVDRVAQNVGLLTQRVDNVLVEIRNVEALVDQGFGVVLGRLGDQDAALAELERDGEATRARLDEARDRHLQIYSLLTREIEELRDLLVALEIDSCTTDRDWDEANAVEESLRANLVSDCGTAFRTLVEALPRNQVSGRMDDKFILAASLNNQRDRMTNESFLEFRQALLSTASDVILPGAVVGPEAWLEIAERYDRFLGLYGDDAARIVRGSVETATNALRLERENLATYGDAIRIQLVKFNTEGERDVFSQLFRRVRELQQRLAGLVDAAIRDYYEDNPGTLRLDGGPYPSPGTEHFNVAAVPDWLRIHRYERCGYENIVSRSQRLRSRVLSIGGLEWTPDASDWFRGRGVLNFVHPHDLLPALMGMGRLEICMTAIEYGGGEHARLGLEVRFVGSDPLDREMTEPCERASSFVEVDGQLRPGGRFDLSGLLLEASRLSRQRSPFLIGEVGKERGGGTGCRDWYLQHFAARQRELSEHVRRRLGDDDDFSDIAVELRIAGHHLRSWSAIAMGGAVEASVTVEALVSGVAGFPDLEGLLEYHPQLLTLAEDAAVLTDVVEEFLRSPVVQDAAVYPGSGHRIFSAEFVELDRQD